MASAARSSSRRKRSEPVSPPIDEDLTAGAWKRTRGTPAAAGDPVTRVVIFDPNDGGQFTELREQDQLIDGVLKVGGERLRIHKVIVCAHSPFLRKLFTSGLAESQQGSLAEVELTDVVTEPLSTLVDSMYTGRLALSPSNVSAVLRTANMLSMDAAEQAAGDFLVEHLEPQTAIASLAFAEQHVAAGARFRTLRSQVLSFLLENFEACAVEASIVELPEAAVVELIGSDKLTVAREEVVLDVVMDWVRHDAENRLSALLQLLPLVRFPLLTGTPIRLVAESELLRQSLPVNTLALRCMCECSAAFTRSPEAADCPRLHPRGGCINSSCHGVQLDYTAQSALWQTVYDEPYSHRTDAGALEERCRGFAELLVGARKDGETTFALCALAPPPVVFEKTTDDQTHEHNGVHWYRSSSGGAKLAMGFAPVQEVELGTADIKDDPAYALSVCVEENGRRRLSWHTEGGIGGWRAGMKTGLYLGECDGWRKVILAR